MSQYKQSYHPTSQQSTKTSKEIIKDFKRFSKTTKKVLDLVADMFFRYPNVCPSQSFIARRSNCERETANRLLSFLEEKGYVRVVSRGKQEVERYKDKTCKYELPEWLTKDVCKALSIFLKSFRFFNVKYLCSRALQIDNEKNVTQVNSLNYNISLNNPCIPRSCIRKSGPQGKDISDGKEIMEANQNVLTTEAIKKIDDVLKLTIHGKCKLRAFDDKALLVSLEKLYKGHGIRNGFEFIINEAIKYSQEHRMKIDWRRYYFLRDSYQIPIDDRDFAEGKTIKGEKVAYIPKRKTSEYERPKDPEADRYGKLSNAKAEQQKIDFEAREAKRAAYWAERDNLKTKMTEGLTTIRENLVEQTKVNDDEPLPF